MAKTDYPSIAEFWQELLMKGKELLINFLSNALNLSEIPWSQTRIVVWILGFLLCFLVLLKLTLTKNKQKKKREFVDNLQKDASFLNTLNKYNINYNLGEFIRNLLKGEDNYKKVFEDYKYFEKLVEEYTDSNTLKSLQESNLSSIRQKLKFTTENPNISFFKTQQLHQDCIIKVFIPDEEYNIYFESKIIENRESYLLLSYPQVKSEEHTLSLQQEINLEVSINQTNYTFTSKVLETKSQAVSELQAFGFKISHTNKIKKLS